MQQLYTSVHLQLYPWGVGLLHKVARIAGRTTAAHMLRDITANRSTAIGWTQNLLTTVSGSAVKSQGSQLGEKSTQRKLVRLGIRYSSCNCETIRQIRPPRDIKYNVHEIMGWKYLIRVGLHAREACDPLLVLQMSRGRSTSLVWPCGTPSQQSISSVLAN
jgi:hypothetical protein